MEDDPLARAVGEVMKDEGRSMDARLEKYAHGQLSAAEIAALHSEAAHDPALQLALELHAPLSGETKAKLHELGKGATGAKVIPFRHRVAVGALAAIAAGALFTVLSTRTPQQLPSYELSARAGDAILRSEHTERGTTRADSEIELILRPGTPLAGRAEARLYVGSADRWTPSPSRPEISDDGAVRWIDRADRLSGGKTGPVSLLMIVALSGKLPSVEEARRTSAGRGWQSSSIEVVIAPLGEGP
jgi:hypothetical protein